MATKYFQMPTSILSAQGICLTEWVCYGYLYGGSPVIIGTTHTLPLYTSLSVQGQGILECQPSQIRQNEGNKSKSFHNWYGFPLQPTALTSY